MVCIFAWLWGSVIGSGSVPGGVMAAYYRVVGERLESVRGARRGG